MIVSITVFLAMFFKLVEFWAILLIIYFAIHILSTLYRIFINSIIKLVD